ncbi:MAG: putative ABC transporter permease [Lachnospiraceae bacterium]
MLTKSCLFFLVCSVLGWIWEVFLNIVVCGTYVNRGFLYGPWLPIYGFGALMVLFIAVIADNPYQVFVISAVACGSMEYITSLVMESRWKMRWWNYSGTFNIHGRINLLVLIVFGCIGLLFYYLLVPRLGWLKTEINTLAKVLTFLLIGIFVVDFVYAQSHPNVAVIVDTISNHHPS